MYNCKELMRREILGVIMSKDLKWKKQCIAAVKKGNRVLGMIKRNFIDRSKETIPAW